MCGYGWTFLLVAIALAVVAFGGYTTTYAFATKIAAGVALMVSVVAFMAEKCETAKS